MHTIALEKTLNKHQQEKKIKGKQNICSETIFTHEQKFLENITSTSFAYAKTFQQKTPSDNNKK